MTRRGPTNLLKGQWDSVTIAALILLVFSVLFGGASREHALRLALVELAALPLLVLSGERLIRLGLWRGHRFALALAGAVVAIPLLQLVPLPPAVWTAVPGREPLALALELAGLQPGWGPLTLTPDQTWRSALALLPPLAMFLAVLSAPPGLNSRLIGLAILATVISLFLGAAQLASGGERLYPWETTAAGSVNGFFANRNHLATLLLSMLPFSLVLGAASLRRRGSDRLPLWLGALFAALVIVGLAAIRSRAGILLFAPVVTVSLLAAWVAAGRGRLAPGLLVLIGGMGTALTAVAAFALPPVLARFDSQSAPEGRFEQWPIVAEAAQTYLPLGSGIGSFDPVFRSVEPLERLDATFFNQAHNEYLETWLETGWLGAALLVLFLVWFGRRAWSAWSAAPSSARDLQRASTIAIGLVLAHSGVDYPLRTVTIATVLAICCALLEFAGQPDPERPARDRRRNG